MDDLTKKLRKCQRDKTELKKALAQLIEKSEEIDGMSSYDIDCVGFGDYSEVIKKAKDTLQRKG